MRESWEILDGRLIHHPLQPSKHSEISYMARSEMTHGCVNRKSLNDIPRERIVKSTKSNSPIHGFRRKSHRQSD